MESFFSNRRGELFREARGCRGDYVIVTYGDLGEQGLVVPALEKFCIDDCLEIVKFLILDAISILNLVNS